MASLTAVILPSDLAARYDVRELCQLADDTDAPIDQDAVDADPVLLAVVADACGDVLTALRQGGRYSEDDLAGLEGVSLAKLKRAVCDIAMTYLMERRPEFNPDRLDRHERLRQRHLEPLRKGENVFDLPDAVEAGQPSVDGPSVQEFAAMNLGRTHAEGRYFPRRRFPL